MFILPIAHQENTARRWPIVAIVLVASNVLIHLTLLLFASTLEAKANAALSEAVIYADEHPHVSAPCLAHVGQARPPTKPPPNAEPSELAVEQQHMTALCAAADRALAELPTFKYGDVPARGGVLTLFTHQFLHGGWLHLLFNMWFLWLTAANLEDRWGRPFFFAFYLASGVGGALLHRLFNPGSSVPMIGASGAIAGAMGGFLVIFASTPIRFAYLFWFGLRPTWGTFEARAIVMLPLWLVSELLSGLLAQDSGTAHWAHVGGFTFGLVVAGIVRLSGLDAKLDRSIEHRAATHQDSRILRAGEAIDQGRSADAVAQLSALLTEQPNNIDARLELLRAARTLHDQPLLARATIELCALYLEGSDMANVTELLLELPRLGLDRYVPRDRYLRLGERLAQKGHTSHAVQVFLALHGGGGNDDVAVRAAVGHATLLARAGQLADARDLLTHVRSRPLTPELASRLDMQLAALTSRIG